MYYISVIKSHTISFKCKGCGEYIEKPVYKIVYHHHNEDEIQPLINKCDLIDQYIEKEEKMIEPEKIVIEI